MEDTMDITKLLNANGRTWLYGVTAAVLALLVGYGLLTQDQAALWAGLVAAILWALSDLTAIKNTTSVGRAALYGVGLAIVGLLVGYNVLNAQQAPLWATLLAGVFGVSTNLVKAAFATPDVKGDDDFEPGEPIGEDEVFN
jgi:hypothetical protein